jgi:hypothetical protein
MTSIAVEGLCADAPDPSDGLRGVDEFLAGDAASYHLAR